MEHLQGKVAVITGAASGIGWAVARRCAGEGMKLVLADIEQPRLEERAELLRAEGAAVHAVTCDVSDGAQVEALAAGAVSTYGAVHLVCNNAGVGGGGLLQDLTVKDWEWVLGVNLWGVIHGVRTFLPILLEQNDGHIVNTASVAGLFAAPFMGPYSVSKFGVVALSETLYHELAMAGTEVGVSVLCPSWVATEIALSARNRPAAMRNEAAPSEAAGDPGAMLHEFIQQGMGADEVAGHVLAAVVGKRFYILTHDDSIPAVQRRMEAIVSQGAPPFVMPQ